jgi:hypothetical protein
LKKIKLSLVKLNKKTFVFHRNDENPIIEKRCKCAAPSENKFCRLWKRGSFSKRDFPVKKKAGTLCTIRIPAIAIF